LALFQQKLLIFRENRENIGSKSALLEKSTQGGVAKAEKNGRILPLPPSRGSLRLFDESIAPFVGIKIKIDSINYYWLFDLRGIPMVEVETLNVELRKALGKRNNRRLRAAGKIPAVLYGHQQENLCLAVPEENVAVAIRRGSRFVQLSGAVREKALIKECQWDTWGSSVLHVDLARVGEHEKIKVEVALELRGEAPGTREGGVVKQLLHVVELECEAASVPEKIDININQLELNQTIHVSNLPLPPGAVVLEDQTAVVVTCEPAVEISDEELEAKVEDEQPEVIGRKKAEEEEA